MGGTVVRDGGASRPVNIARPVIPEGAVEFSLSQDDANLAVTTSDVVYFVIPNNARATVQQIQASGEDGPSGSKVDVFFDDVGTERIIDRVYTAGSMASTMPGTRFARDGTLVRGNAAGTRRLGLRRTSIAGTSKEVDAIVYGYTNT